MSEAIAEALAEEQLQLDFAREQHAQEHINQIAALTNISISDANTNQIAAVRSQNFNNQQNRSRQFTQFSPFQFWRNSGNNYGYNSSNNNRNSSNRNRFNQNQNFRNQNSNRPSQGQNSFNFQRQPRQNRGFNNYNNNGNNHNNSNRNYTSRQNRRGNRNSNFEPIGDRTFQVNTVHSPPPALLSALPLLAIISIFTLASVASAEYHLCAQPKDDNLIAPPQKQSCDISVGKSALETIAEIFVPKIRPTTMIAHKCTERITTVCTYSVFKIYTNIEKQLTEFH